MWSKLGGVTDELAGTNGWTVRVATGTAQELHDLAPDLGDRSVVVQRVASQALVLGSTQDRGLVNEPEAESRGVEIAKRRSGGGAVLLAPMEQCWIDVLLPVGDPLWEDDISRSSRWLGETWSKVAESYGWVGPEVHGGGISDPIAARLVCFAALGPGEVTAGDRKIVGISQRRTRLGARFQCIAYIRWDPDPLIDLLHLGAHASQMERTLRTSAASIVRPTSSGGAVDYRAEERVLAERFVQLLP